MWSSEKHPALEALSLMRKEAASKDERRALQRHNFLRALRMLMNDHQGIKHEEVGILLLDEARLILSGECYNPALCRAQKVLAIASEARRYIASRARARSDGNRWPYRDKADAELVELLRRLCAEIDPKDWHRGERPDATAHLSTGKGTRKRKRNRAISKKSA